ncbi:MAG: hypothetical protein IBX69_08680 [Anaerolineales bacterium]|nr:hypothetical protein [Anaerolineales bacterium]
MGRWNLEDGSLVWDYTITPKGFTEAVGMTFSKGLVLLMPVVKEESDEIRPLTGRQLNLAYFELLVWIYNEAEKQVDLCVVDLLPGARDPQRKINFLILFKKVGGDTWKTFKKAFSCTELVMVH